MRYCFQEMLCHLETAACHFSPEVFVLLNVFLYSRGVADDAETYEGHIIYIASVSDGARFHVYGEPCGEVLLNGVELFARGDKLVARANQSAMYLCGLLAVERHSCIY